MEAYVMITTTAGTSPSLLPEVRAIDGVERANIVAGEYDVVVAIAADSREELLALVTDEIQSLPGVERTQTSVVLE